MVNMRGIASTKSAHCVQALPTTPSYPTNSLEFLTSVRQQNGIHPAQSLVKLDVVIVGAGIGGLATACALARRGHTVTVLEQSHTLGEVRCQ